MIVIATTIGGAFVGGIIGVVIGEREGGDFNIAPAIYGPIGAAIGAIGGCVLGVILPHIGVSWH